MYELSLFLTWLGATAAGILLNILQEIGQENGWSWVAFFNQKLLAVVLAVLAGAVAYVAEVVLGFDLFSDVANLSQIASAVGTAIIAFLSSQATFSLRHKGSGVKQ